MDLSNAPLVNDGEPSLSVSEGEREDKDWSSLPVLVLWMIKDKLNIVFDHWRVAAVCHSWRSASNQYPKVLQSVGDGLPRISTFVVNNKSTSIQFFSVVERQQPPEFKLEMPKYSSNRVLFSKQGWILLCQTRFLDSIRDFIYLVNPFTKNKIELPSCGRCKFVPGFHARFTTSSDGYPERVFMVKSEDPTVIIKTIILGEDSWTDHTFAVGPHYCTGGIVTIGHKVYFEHGVSGLMEFSVSDDSVRLMSKPNPDVLSRGFMAEYGGDLIYVNRDCHFSSTGMVRYDFSLTRMYRYDEAAASWERLEKDISLFTDYRCSIATKGKGRKLYVLCGKSKNFDGDDVPGFRVEVHDLATGDKSFIPIYVQDGCDMCWVDIG